MIIIYREMLVGCVWQYACILIKAESKQLFICMHNAHTKCTHTTWLGLYLLAICHWLNNGMVVWNSVHHFSVIGSPSRTYYTMWIIPDNRITSASQNINIKFNYGNCPEWGQQQCGRCLYVWLTHPACTNILVRIVRPENAQNRYSRDKCPKKKTYSEIYVPSKYSRLIYMYIVFHIWWWPQTSVVMLQKWSALSA